MQTLSTWTEEEYAAVAVALRYPASRLGAVTIGYSPTVQMAYQLGPKLEQIPTSQKPRVLALAQQVLTAEDRLTSRVLGGGCDDDRDVIRVGDITFDRNRGRDELATQVERLRGRLADLVDFPVNQANAGSGTGGGINGTWST